MLVEDDPAIRRLVTFLLENEGFEVAAHEDTGATRAASEEVFSVGRPAEKEQRMVWQTMWWDGKPWLQ